MLASLVNAAVAGLGEGIIQSQAQLGLLQASYESNLADALRVGQTARKQSEQKAEYVQEPPQVVRRRSLYELALAFVEWLYLLSGGKFPWDEAT